MVGKKQGFSNMVSFMNSIISIIFGIFLLLAAGALHGTQMSLESRIESLVIAVTICGVICMLTGLHEAVLSWKQKKINMNITGGSIIYPYFRNSIK